MFPGFCLSEMLFIARAHMRSIHTGDLRVQTTTYSSPLIAESVTIGADAPSLIPKQLKEVLTINELAEILRCSRNHVSNVMNGKVSGVPVLPHFVMGRRKLVRREWLIEWLQSYRTQC